MIAYDKSRYQTVDFEQKYGKYLQQLDTLLSGLHDGVCISNDQGVIIKMNPMYEKLSGLSPESLIGKKVKNLNNGLGIFTKAELDIEESEKKHGLYHGPVSPLVLKRKQASTSIQTTINGNSNLLHGYPLFDEEGEVVLVVTFIRDISQLTIYQEEQMAYHKWLSHSLIKHVPLSINSEHGGDYVFCSQLMKQLLEQIKTIAKTDVPVLILGETGVGKDVIARMIHSFSDKNTNIFFKADCASIPENLVESEFFGYAKGAFSGAEKQGKLGYFAAASQGTIFLDEIGELPLLMQAKLLRVLQDKEILQIGALTPQSVDTRVIAATNVDLEEAIKNGTFRRDLFYRLNVCPLYVPPLRERAEDILFLAEFFLGKFNTKYKKNVELSKESEKILLSHAWPGNVRELQNLIHGIVINCNNKFIYPHDFPYSIQKSCIENTVQESITSDTIAQGTLKEMTAQFEQAILQKAFDDCGSLSKVAKLYNIDRTTVARKLKK